MMTPTSSSVKTIWRPYMRQHLSLTAVVVRDYDEAIVFFVDRLGFELREDTRLDEEKRWVVVAPPGSTESGILLAKAANPGQAQAIGNQSGGRVFLFLATDDFERDYDAFRKRGIKFVEEAARVIRHCRGV